MGRVMGTIDDFPPYEEPHTILPDGTRDFRTSTRPLTDHAHSSEHNEHYTPEWIALRGHVVLEGITFDPFSCARANEVIKASDYWAIDKWQHSEQVFQVPWYTRIGNDGAVLPTRIFCNPPGGKLDPETLAPLPRNANNRQGGPGLSAAGVAFGKLSHEWAIGNVHSALFLAFSLNVFRTAQSDKVLEHFPQALPPTAFPFMTFRDRIKFETIDPETGARVTAGGGTPQDSAIVFLPPRYYNGAWNVDALSRFRQQYEDQGHVRI